MSTYAEDPNPNIWEQLRRWKSSIGWLNTRVPQRLIFPLFSLMLGAKYEGGWGGHMGFGKADVNSLFYNGAFFLRVIFCPLWTIGFCTALVILKLVWFFIYGYWLASPLWLGVFAIGFIGVGVRWSEKGVTIAGKTVAFMQTYIGVKLNGEWAVVPRLRFQNDDSAAAGTTGANNHTGLGWNAGTK